MPVLLLGSRPANTDIQPGGLIHRLPWHPKLGGIPCPHNWQGTSPDADTGTLCQSFLLNWALNIAELFTERIVCGSSPASHG
ncbi:hypothetical protein M514_00647 [Trichuris suis]|uniref:Uncharacterized protein n=1 Tax=Trichuris suis TaxID=68888 RepID=A0A085N721_9BILA|nr:hypothetical protein M513_00647 [Trichuris suis]KFD65267.1 hypothetical protein M514_00647 [Trichuris suis]